MIRGVIQGKIFFSKFRLKDMFSHSIFGAEFESDIGLCDFFVFKRFC